MASQKVRRCNRKLCDSTHFFCFGFPNAFFLEKAGKVYNRLFGLTEFRLDKKTSEENVPQPVSRDNNRLY